MKKAEFVEWVAWRSGTPKYRVARVLRAFALAIQETVKNHGRVTIWGLGTFRSRGTAWKTIRNFEGQWADFDLGRKVCFTPAPSLKDAAKE